MSKSKILYEENNSYAALRYPEFRNLVLGSFFITLALLAQEVAIVYELYRVTHNPLSLGLIVLVEAIPFISFSLFGGHIADRYSKRKILLWSVGSIAVSSLILQIIARRQDNISQASFLIII